MIHWWAPPPHKNNKKQIARAPPGRATPGRWGANRLWAVARLTIENFPPSHHLTIENFPQLVGKSFQPCPNWWANRFHTPWEYFSHPVGVFFMLGRGHLRIASASLHRATGRAAWTRTPTHSECKSTQSHWASILDEDTYA